MKYKKAELLPSGVYLVDMGFIKEAFNNAIEGWEDSIRECVASTHVDYIMNDKVEVPKSLVLDALKDESICESWKEKIKEVFEPKSEYYNFGENGYQLNSYSVNYPMFIGKDITPNEKLECVLIDIGKWEVYQEEVNLCGASYLKLKFKKK